MISLLAPSRGRAEKSLINIQKWIAQAGCDIEVIVSVDKSDPSHEWYLRVYSQAWQLNPNGKPRVMMLIEDNDCVVKATNMAAKESKGEILIYVSDDFDCFPNWGQAVISEFEKHEGPTLIKVDDMLQPFHVAVLTIPIMNRACYDKLGYFFHPGYKSMFVDEHLYWRSKKLGFLKMAPNLKFEHCHVSVGKAKDDETYRRSAANWDQGKQLFAAHKKAGFMV